MKLIPSKRSGRFIAAGIVAAMLTGGGVTVAVAAGATGAIGVPSGPVLYSSLVTPLSPANPSPPNEWWSLGFAATGATQLGDKVNLIAPSILGSATVILDSQACQTEGSGASPPCVTTTPGTFPVPITFTIYQPGTSGGTVGPVIATETATFNVPYRPSGNATACAAGTNSIFAGYSNNGSQWFNPATGSCYYGVTYAATFSNFTWSTPPKILPSTVVYGVSYPTTSIGEESLNVLFSTESSSGAVTVGSDTDPGNLFVAGSSSPDTGLGGTSGEITCSTVGTSFEEYNTAVGASGCGTDTQQAAGAPYEPIAFVPAVQINA